MINRSPMNDDIIFDRLKDVFYKLEIAGFPLTLTQIYDKLHGLLNE